MATYNKFNVFVQDLCSAKHDFSADTLKLALTNTSPNAADTVVDTTTSPDTVKATSNAVEVANGNGYTEGGASLTITTNSQSGGTYTLAANQIVWTCATAAMGTFRYPYLYNSSKGAAATRPVISWWDYGSSITLNVGETFTAKFNNANPGTIFTLA